MLPIWVVLFRGTFEVLCFLEVLLGCFHLVAVVMLPQRGKLVPAASGWSLNSGGLLFRRSTCLCLTLVGLSSINWSHPRPGGSVSKQGWSRSRCNTQLWHTSKILFMWKGVFPTTRHCCPAGLGPRPIFVWWWWWCWPQIRSRHLGNLSPWIPAPLCSRCSISPGLLSYSKSFYSRLRHQSCPSPRASSSRRRRRRRRRRRIRFEKYWVAIQIAWYLLDWSKIWG